MSPKLHLPEKQFINPIQRALEQKTFGNFSQFLMHALDIRTIAAKVSLFNEKRLYKPGYKFIVDDFWMGLETSTIDAYLQDIKTRARELLNEALTSRSTISSQISYLGRQRNYYYEESNRYNIEDYEFFLKDLTFWIIGPKKSIMCSYLQLDITTDQLNLLQHNLAVRRNLLASIGREITKLLNEIIYTYEYKPKFKWSGESPELDITEIGLAIINAPQFSTLDGEAPSLFVEKLLELFGYSGKAISKNRGNIVKRRKKESVMNELKRSIDSLIETTPISKSRQKKSKNTASRKKN